MSNQRDSWKDNRGNTYNKISEYNVKVSNPVTGIKTKTMEQIRNERK